MFDISIEFIGYLLVMAIVTYLVRMLPMVFCRRKIKSRFIRSFLYYAPYAVLSAMTFPAIMYSTSNPISAAVGTCVALILAFFGKSLITVAACAALGVFACELIMAFIPM